MAAALNSWSRECNTAETAGYGIIEKVNEVATLDMLDSCIASPASAVHILCRFWSRICHCKRWCCQRMNTVTGTSVLHHTSSCPAAAGAEVVDDLPGDGEHSLDWQWQHWRTRPVAVLTWYTSAPTINELDHYGRLQTLSSNDDDNNNNRPKNYYGIHGAIHMAC